MHFAQGPQRSIQDSRADYVRPRGQFGAQITSVPVAIEKDSVKTDRRGVQMQQQRVAGHLY